MLYYYSFGILVISFLIMYVLLYTHLRFCLKSSTGGTYRKILMMNSIRNNAYKAEYTNQNINTKRILNTEKNDRLKVLFKLLFSFNK